MSFSSDVKSELCRLPLGSASLAAVEVYGALLFANCFTHQEIRVITAHADFAQRLPRLLRRAFGFGPDAAERSGARGKHVLTIREPEKIAAIFARFGCSDLDCFLAHHVNFSVLEEEGAGAAFLRGAFLAGGSVTDPDKRCHLELVTDHRSVAGGAFVVLRELGFAPKQTERKGHAVIYFKQSDAIGDLCTTMGAPAAALRVMSAKIEKDMRNTVNRRVNCDNANADKIVSAAQAQLDRLREIERDEGLDALPDELRQIALLRIANPEASLSDLAQLSDPPVSKSAVAHRMRRLMGWKSEES